MTPGKPVGDSDCYSTKEPDKMTFAAYAQQLNIPLDAAIDLARFVRSRMREDLVCWLNNPDKWESNS